MQALDAILNQLKHLPPAPRVLSRLLQVLDQPDTETGEVVRLLRYEPSLTAHLLRACNSAYFAGGQKVESLEEALLRLGFRRVYQVVIGLYCEGLLAAPQPGYGIDGGELWDHSMVAAITSGVLAERGGTDPNLAFTAGLLHDLGKIALSATLLERYAAVVAEIESRQQPFLDAEKSVLGVQHAEIGGRLLERWQLSDRLVAAVWHHHAPAQAGAHRALAAQVYLGNMIAHFLGHGYGHYAFAFRGQAEALDILRLTERDLPELLIAASERLQTEAGLVALKG